MKLTVRLKGGAGSGHHGHSGIPGKQGGSLPGNYHSYNAVKKVAENYLDPEQVTPFMDSLFGYSRNTDKEVDDADIEFALIDIGLAAEHGTLQKMKNDLNGLSGRIEN